MKMRLVLSLFLALAVGSCIQAVRQSPQTEKEAAMPAAQNPFFEEWKTPFGVPPFGSIQDAHYLPAFRGAMARHREEIEAIHDNPEAPDFANTVEALARSGKLLKRVDKVFFSQLNANTNDAMDEAAKQVAPELARHRDAIILDEKLFARLKAVYQRRDEIELSVEQRTLLDETYQDFVRGGAELSTEKKAELRGINARLALLTLGFSQNVLKEDNRFELVIEDRADLAGLPERAVAAAAQAAGERGHPGKWVFTLHKPSLIPFLQYARKRDLREKMLQGYTCRGDHGDASDNKKIIKNIIDLRLRKANLLGYASYADFALSRRMAKKPDNVTELLDRVWKAALAAAKQEARALQALIDQEGGGFSLAPWDWWFYVEKLRKAKYDLDDNELRPYFELENVWAGAVAVAGKLYGLKFILRDDIPTYHPEVKSYEVQEADGRHLGVFYLDPHPRASKRGGAWCGGYRETSKHEGKRIAPLVVNVTNFSAPIGDKPALLSLQEVLTLFHEFGHALHALLADITYERVAEAVRVDFVELPSQIMENWALEPEVLQMYARHHQTGEPIPDELVAKILKSRCFNQGFKTVEYLAACYLDLDWHRLEQTAGVDVQAFETRSLERIGLIPEIMVRYRSPYFRHIFGGDDYAAGYYSYIWAAVLDADAFEAFKAKGLFDRRTAQAFRENVLAAGGAEDPKVLYRRFRGADPKIEPLLRRRGLLQTAKSE